MMHWHHRVTLLGILTLIITFPIASHATSSTTQQMGGVAVIVNDAIVITDEVNGDLFLFGETVTIAAPINGDLFVAAKTIDIQSPITGSLRAAAQKLTIASSIGRNLLVGTQTFVMKPESSVTGTANIYTRSATLDGVFTNTIHTEADNVAIKGLVQKGGTIRGHDIRFFGTSVIRGPLDVISSIEPVRDPSMKGIQHLTIRVASKESVQKENLIQKKFRSWFLHFVLMIGIGSMIVALWPQKVQIVTDRMRQRPGTTWLRGLLFFGLFPISFMILCLTIIGIPLAILSGLLLIPLMLIVRIFPALLLGQHLLDHPRLGAGRKKMVLQLVGGYFLLSLMMSVPYFGWLINFLATIWGIGVLLTRSVTPGKKNAAKLSPRRRTR